MAIIARGHTPCVLCREAVGEHDDLVAAPHFVEHPNEVFAGFSDVPFHRVCFLRWPLRPAFVARFNTLAERRIRDGLVMRMQDDGGTILLPPSPDPAQDAPEPLVVSLPSSERRPGLHAMLNPCEQPVERARLILALHVPVPAGRLRAVLSAQVRVAGIGQARALVDGSPGFPLRLLDAAPARTLSASDAWESNVHYIEAGDGRHDGTLLRPRAAYVACVAGECRAAAIRCWAVQG